MHCFHQSLGNPPFGKGGQDGQQTSDKPFKSAFEKKGMMGILVPVQKYKRHHPLRSNIA
jgi:hypothetical protein